MPLCPVIYAHVYSPGTQRLLGATHTQMGDVLILRRQEGDSAKVLTHYTRSLDLAEALLEANPASGEAARDVWLSLNKLGDFLAMCRQPGDADKALGYYTRGLDLRETLLKANPGSGEAARDVSVSLEKLGHFLATRGQPGDADKALGYYTRGLDLRETLLKANPGSGEAARDVSVSLNKLGAFLAKRGQLGDADKALGYFTRSLDLRETLLKANPGSGVAARDVSVSLNTLGDFLATRGQPGDAEKAFGFYTRGLEIAETLLKANPGSGEAARDVSVSLERLGDFLATRGQPGDADKALGFYTRDLEIAETLLKANPGSAQAARDVVVSHYKMAALARGRGDVAGEEKHSRAIYDVLKPCIERGMTFDSTIVRVYEGLEARFSGK